MNLYNLYKKFKYNNKIKKKKQQVLFEDALREINEFGKNDNIFINHEIPLNYKNSIAYPVIFPMTYVKRVNQISYEKELLFSFVGFKTENREWINEYDNYKGNMNSLIRFTNKGRIDIEKKFDVDYYYILKRSMFVLCPAGDFLWTYRFYESLLCKSIPIIRKNQMHDSYNGFNFIYHENINESLEKLIKEKHTYEKLVNHNYILFLKRHTFLNNILGDINFL